MSTKIYQGFRLKTDSFQEALNIVNGFRQWVNNQAEIVIDNFMENAEKAKKNPDADCYMLWLELRQKVLREKEMRAPNIDTDFSITLIPTNGFVLGIVYTEHRDWYEEWCKQPGVEEYSYWNNTDKPENMSDAEWDTRAKDWSVINWKPACLQGFSIDLVDPLGPSPKWLRGEK